MKGEGAFAGRRVSKGKGRCVVGRGGEMSIRGRRVRWV